MTAVHARKNRLSAPKFRQLKHDGRKIVMLTAYDWATACLLDAAGVDAILVGDSLANVVQGKGTTLPVTLREIIYHAEMVARAATRAMVIVDLPFPYCQSGKKEAVRAAARIFKESQADAVKIEGGRNRAKTIHAVVEAGIPVLGHCGLMPQDIRRLGGFSVQRDREQLLEDVRAVEDAGAFGVVVECVPADLAKEATLTTMIPTIGIGAGPDCDGQVLVLHDILGFGETRPRHNKVYAEIAAGISDAVGRYAEEVRSGTFPTPEQSF